jgi:hypothetical protein
MPNHNTVRSDGVLSDRPSDGKATDADDPMPGRANAFSDVRNVLGFLLAGFGAILSFLGLRSSEITTVLRNDSLQASLIVLILLIGIMAAVSAVVTNSKSELVVPSAAAIGLLLFGMGALVIFAIPTEASPLTLSGGISLGIGCFSACAGVAALAFYGPFWVAQDAKDKAKPEPASDVGNGDIREDTKLDGVRTGTEWPSEGGAPGESRGSSSKVTNAGRFRRRWPDPALRWPGVPLTDALILASVILTVIAAYGSMRLETKSQLSFSAQVGASFVMDGSLATAFVNVSAAKIAQSDWVYVGVYALPVGIKEAKECTHVHVPSTEASCVTDPCHYFDMHQYAALKAQCTVLLNGSVVPNATGNVDETIKVPFSPSNYQDIDVRAYVCSIREAIVNCEGSPSGQNSRLDYAVPGSSTKPN